jgi:peptidoglycan endopeptidase LytE
MKPYGSLLMRFAFLCFFSILIFPLPARADFSHTVKPGDSLFRIAKKFHVAIFQIQAANGLGDEKIYPGQRLIIPVAFPKAGTDSTAKKSAHAGAGKTGDAGPDVAATHIVKKGETVPKIAQRYRLRDTDLEPINPLPGRKLKAGPTPYFPRPGEAREGLEEGRENSGVEGKAERAEFARDSIRGRGFLLDEKDQEHLVRVASGFLGLKYSRGGSTSNGVDCSAFVQKVFRLFGIDLPRTAREQFQVGYQVAREALEIGDLVFFKRSKTTRPTHVGIYLGDGRFIHTSLRKQRVYIDLLDSRYFAARFIGGKRIEDFKGSPGPEELIRNGVPPGE